MRMRALSAEGKKKVRGCGLGEPWEKDRAAGLSARGRGEQSRSEGGESLKSGNLR